jgi:glycosyltransferase involved in cell wall biosynthesis
LFLSRLHPKKGVEHLIDAARLLQDRGRPHQVLIAGTGPEDYERVLRDLVRRRGIEGLVSFLGMVVGEDKISLYQASTVFALPTSQENFGFVFYEALAAGCPVITTRGVDTWPELARAGATIIDQDARQLADAIDHITRDREQREQLGTRGRGWVLENLDPASLTHRYAEFYARATT